jgi:hypothetical protein
MAVEDEEHVGREEADTLVPIEERVVLDESVSVGGGEVGKIGIRFVPPSILGASDGGVQQAFIAKARLPSMGPDLIRVSGLYCGTWDPSRFLTSRSHLASSRRALRYLPAVRS